MDIHKPKPWHGLREFLKEIGTIVIGVLIALGAEQAVEWLHWRHEVAVAREAIAFDLKALVGSAAAQDEHTPCTGRHLQEIAAVINQAQTTKRLAPMGWNGAPPQGAWTLRSWSALNSGQTLAHFPNREQIILAGLDSKLQRMRALSDSELDDWSTLGILTGPGRPISDPEIAAARVAFTHAIRDAGYLRAHAREVETIVAQSRLVSARDMEAAYKDAQGLLPTTTFCKATPAPQGSLFVSPFFTGPPVHPGETTIVTPGVGHAFTTEK